MVLLRNSEGEPLIWWHTHTRKGTAGERVNYRGWLELPRNTMRFLPGIALEPGSIYSGSRSLELYWLHAGNYVRWRLWRNENVSRAHDWRDRGIDLDALIFGQARYTVEDVLELEYHLDMPEGRYPCRVKSYVAVWTHKRWKRPTMARRIELDFPVPVPMPGNSDSDYYDDDDAIRSVTIAADSIESALAYLRNDILTQRGGETWVPADGWELHKLQRQD